MCAAINNSVGVAGSSTGAAIQQAGPMVTGGESYYGVRDGAEPGYSSDANKLTYHPEGGF
jgi:cyanophycinase